MGVGQNYSFLQCFLMPFREVYSYTCGEIVAHFAVA